MTYDLIGDVHGQFLKLKNVLKHLGYEKKKGVYSKKNHCAIFIGDLVDRGRGSMKVVELVKNMVESGTAEAILGNHEYNLFGFLTKDENKKYLRPHSVKNKKQVKETLLSYGKNTKMLQEHLQWMSNLPLYINKPEFRAVHACWDKPSYKYIKKNVGRFMTDKVLRDSYKCGSDLEHAVKMLVTGPELNLPEKLSQKDADGQSRSAMRYKWWKKIEGKTYQEIAIKDADSLPKIQVTLPGKFVSQHYSTKKKPLFFGHYSMNGTPELLESNVCCLDWINNKGPIKNRIIVYRFNGEEKLDPKNLNCFF